MGACARPWRRFPTLLDLAIDQVAFGLPAQQEKCTAERPACAPTGANEVRLDRLGIGPCTRSAGDVARGALNQPARQRLVAGDCLRGLHGHFFGAGIFATTSPHFFDSASMNWPKASASR